MSKKLLALSLFWRTFVLLALLLAGGVFAWTQTFRALEFEPRAVQAAQQIASLVNLARSALRSSDGINRIALIKSMSNQASVKLAPREPQDKWVPYEVDRFSKAIGSGLRSQLGPDTLVASAVNGVPGLWVGFSIEKDPYWLQTDRGSVGPMAISTLSVWVGIALLATILGSATIARLINQPLRDLSFAASRIREGEFESHLDETTLTSEVRQVNMGFNRMARELAKVEADRAVMLAGISHDLRTPLALCVAATGFFFVVDLVFLAANAVKVLEGGWFPLVIGAGVFTLMVTWKAGRKLMAERMHDESIELGAFLESIFINPPLRVPGTAVFLSAEAGSTPFALLHNLKHNKVLHEQNLFVTVMLHEVPWIGFNRRCQIEPLRRHCGACWQRASRATSPCRRRRWG